MAKRENGRISGRQKPDSFPLIWIFGVAAVLLVAGIVAWVATSGGDSGASRIGPRVSVDQDRIDFGRVPFDKTVRAEFKITNTGDRPLTLDASSPITALKGC